MITADVIKIEDSVMLVSDSVNLVSFDTINSVLSNNNIESDSITNIVSRNLDNNIWTEIDIPLFVSIIIFILGFCINEFITKYHKRKELILYKDLIVSWWEKSKKTLDDYIKSLNEFQKSIQGNNDLNIVKVKINIVQVSKIASLPLEKITETLVVNLKAKDKQESTRQMMSFLFQLDYIDKVQIEIRANYDKYYMENQKIRDEWNYNYSKLIELLQEYRTIVDLFSVEIQYLKYIENQFYKMSESMKNGVFDMSNWEKDFVEPCLLYAKEYQIFKYRRMISLISLLNGLSIGIKKHQNLKKYSEIFLEYKKNLDTAETIIVESVNYIKNHNINCFPRIS